MAEPYQNISKIYPDKRAKPGPRTQLPRSKVRDRCVTTALNDEEVEALDIFRKSHACICVPTRSAFVAWIIRQYIAAHRRPDVPGVVPKGKAPAKSKAF